MPASIIGEQFVPARLWQDPFDVEGSFDSRDRRTSASQMAVEVKRKASGSISGQVLVVAAMVEGNPYPEDKEVRRRLRYSLQRSVGGEGYIPFNRSHIGVVSIDWPESILLTDDYTYNKRALVIPRILPREISVSQSFSGDSSTKDVIQDLVGPEILWRVQNSNAVTLSASIAVGSEKRISIPFEWFIKEDKSSQPVLVLWLREEFFADEPFRRLDLLRHAIFEDAMTNVSRFALIGPRSSNTLKGFLEAPDLEMEIDGIHTNLVRKLQIFTCQATVPASILSKSNQAGPFSEGNRGKWRSRTDSLFVDCIATDDQLATQTVKELTNRNPNISASKSNTRPDQVVLLYESDTIYGRSLVQVFSNELVSVSRSNFQQNLLFIPYQRGIDGNLPKGADEFVGKEQATSRSLARTEKAEGDHQLDYVRRVARFLRLRNQEEVETNLKGTIAAIGVLGSDVYDKLLLLQVLRMEFPDALYFTTDLDARLMHRDENGWARNLIVASAYDLTPNGSAGRIVFRDSYQTAFFTACRKAINGDLINLTTSPKLFEIGRTRAQLLSPIANWNRDSTLEGLGKYLALSLIIVLLALVLSRATALLGQFRTFFAWVQWLLRKSSTKASVVSTLLGAAGIMAWLVMTPHKNLVAVLVIFLAVVASLFYFRGFARWLHQATRLTCEGSNSVADIKHEEIGKLVKTASLPRNRRMEEVFYRLEKRTRRAASWSFFGSLFLGIAALIAILWVSDRVSRNPGEEPLEWNPPNYWGATFEGISAWPTEWLRVIVISFCWCSILWAYWRYRAGLFSAFKSHKIRMFPLGVRNRRKMDEVRKPFKKWHEEWSVTRWPELKEPGTGEVCALKWFICYQQRGSLPSRLKRITCFAFVFGAFAMAVMHLGGFPVAPLRGSYTQAIDKWLLIAMIVSLICLMAYVVDLTRLSERLIARLGDGNTKWPEDLTKEKSAETGVEGKNLAGIIDVEFVAWHTKQINIAVLLPFIAIMLAGFSRASLFDRWPWPISLKIVYFAYCFCAGICTWTLRSAAQRVKEGALRQLETAKYTSKETPRSDRISALIDRIRAKRIGAYNRWWEDPAFIGILIPPGTAGAFNLLKTIFLG